MISNKLIYSLPFNCPIEWPIKPNYPIASTIRDLNLVYKNTLFNIENQPLQFALDNFARLLLSLTSEQTSDSLSILLRSLLLPAKEFDKRWRYTIPEVFKPIDDNLPLPILSVTSGNSKNREKEKLAEEKAKLSALERGMLLDCHERWKESVRKDAGLIPAATTVKEGGGEKEAEEGKKMVVDGMEEVPISEGSGKPASWLVQDDKIGDWLRDLETLETLIQSLLLLTLLCLPPPSSLDCSSAATIVPSRRRTKDPQRSNTTLDPEILLDFLTDRLQVWAAVKSMTGAGLGKDVNGVDNVRLEAERDLVQCWWEDIVEPLFSPHLLPELLLHHRVKLFPSTSSTFALSTAASYVPSPSPYKKSTDRTLLSLDKSARRKEWQEEKDRIPESPTMRRLGINAGSRLGGNVMAAMGGEEEEVFKVPVAPRRRGSVSGTGGNALHTSTSSGSLDPFMTSMTTDTTLASTSTSNSTSLITNPTSSKSRSRKQERPRPSTSASSLSSSSSSSSRGDSMVSSLKGLFTHREVSLARRPNGSSSTSSNLFSTASSSKFKKSDTSLTTSLDSEVSQPKVLGMTATGRTSRPRKRKSLSPQKRPTSESTFLASSASSLSSSSSSSRQVLAIDTPQKVSKTSTGIVRPKIPLPTLSFAALGAAFRPGLPPPPDLPKGIPRPPVLSDEEGEEGSGEDRMDWEDLRGGRNSIGMMGTPVRKGREEWCVPDT